MKRADQAVMLGLMAAAFSLSPTLDLPPRRERIKSSGRLHEKRLANSKKRKAIEKATRRKGRR